MTDAELLIVERQTTERLSGGYRYNSAMAAELQKRGRGGLVQLDHARLMDSLSARTLLVDSLWLLNPPPAALHRAAPERQLVLLAHYFPPADPVLDLREKSRWRENARAWLSLVDRVVVTGYRALEDWSSLWPVEKMVVVPPAIPQRRGSRGRPTTRDRDTIQLLTLGSVTPAKLPLSLLESLHWLRERNLRWTILGSLDVAPAHVEDCRSYLRANGLSHCVELAGAAPPDAAEAALRAADIYLATSVFESFGMASAEALACGVPLLGFDTGDIRRWLGDDPACRLFPRSAPGAFSGQLRAWLDLDPGTLPQPSTPQLPCTDWASAAEHLLTALDPSAPQG